MLDRGDQRQCFLPYAQLLVNAFNLAFQLLYISLMLHLLVGFALVEPLHVSFHIGQKRPGGSTVAMLTELISTRLKIENRIPETNKRKQYLPLL